ncbi:MAG: phosphoribosylformylglycinamidine synthase subunit PurS [candidate division Zixibacteria bacterium]|nr:phosphoribosylformylglycinamidine synthase subunit PurS [candidate division Zixibacteria bacterium]
MVRAKIRVELKDGVLDPQGVTIKNALVDMGYPEIASVKSGKTFDLEIDLDDRELVETKLDEMCRKLLANPVIEQYSVEVYE